MQRIVFRVTADTFGLPDPLVPNGAILIMVQDGRASLSRYESPTSETPWPAFDHPINIEELEAEALAAVLAEFPEAELHSSNLIFTCPAELAAKAVWKS